MRRIVTLVSHSGSKEEQGTVQGAAGALESLGRAIGPVWGHGALQHFGEGSAYATAAVAFFATTFLIVSYQAPSGADGMAPARRRLAHRVIRPVSAARLPVHV